MDEGGEEKGVEKRLMNGKEFEVFMVDLDPLKWVPISGFLVIVPSYERNLLLVFKKTKIRKWEQIVG